MNTLLLYASGRKKHHQPSDDMRIEKYAFLQVTRVTMSHVLLNKGPLLKEKFATISIRSHIKTTHTL